jgi:hypothetical protein
MRQNVARCARSNWKWKPKCASGDENVSRKSSNKKPTGTVGFFPHSRRPMWHARRQPLSLRTAVGPVELEVWYGYDPAAQGWGCPIRQCWGLRAHQQMSPGLQDKVLFTATATGTYEQTAAVVSKWGCPMDDSTVHALVQRLGARAQAQTQARLKTTPQEIAPQRAPSALAVAMVDGFLARFRGRGWGQEHTQEPHVEWHEIKTGVFYLSEQASVSQSGRGLLSEKVIVSWQGPAVELGERLHHEALRRGLGRARALEAVGDGAEWIWHLVEARWPGAVQVLDFYHASQHLWELARGLHGADELKVAAWVQKRRHQLRHGQEKKVLRAIARLQPPRGERGKIVRREQQYFASQSGRLAYEVIAARGWPIGSGAVESACRQRQCRYKRAGQFWTSSGLRCLNALEEARAHGHWDQLWSMN